MNKLVSTAIVTVGMLLCGVASAEDMPAATAATMAPAVKAGGMLKSADGHRIGFVDAVDMGKNGAAVAAQVIVGSRVVRVPVSTITVTDKSHFITSLSYKEVEHL